ncbi:MAG: hypothetical protein M1461_03810 [Nitrospirae bacterium]|nr:hypothetical protein [Nitrospirota bacterium]
MKKGLTFFLTFSLILLLSHYAGSEEGRWKLFGKSMTGTLWYMDTETVTMPAENIVAVWVKSIPDKTSTHETEEKEKTEAILKRIQEKYFGEYEYTDGLWELDCSKSLFRLLYFCAYTKNGDILTSRLTPDAEWSSILPGSAGEALFRAVCSR